MEFKVEFALEQLEWTERDFNLHLNELLRTDSHVMVVSFFELDSKNDLSLKAIGERIHKMETVHFHTFNFLRTNGATLWNAKADKLALDLPLGEHNDVGGHELQRRRADVAAVPDHSHLDGF